MKTIHYTELQAEIKRHWSKNWLFPTDKVYIVKSIQYIIDYIKRSGTRDIVARGNQMSCDDISIIALGDLKRQRYIMGQKYPDSKTYDYSISIGLCFGTLFNGIPGKHYQLIAYAEEGLFLIEPQKYTYWQPSRSDNVLWEVI